MRGPTASRSGPGPVNRYDVPGMSATSSALADLGAGAVRVPRPGRLRATLFVGLANLGLACLIGTSYLDSLPPDLGPRLWCFAHAGLLTSLLTLALVPGSFLALAAVSRLGERTFLVAQTLTWSLFHLTLFIDTRVFGLYHYHLNGAAWNLLTTRGSQDSYHLGARIWALGIAMFALFSIGQWLLWKLAWLRIERTRGRNQLRSAYGLVFLFAGSIAVEKTIYADADLSRDRELVAMSKMFPIYPRLRVSEFMGGTVHAAQARAPRIEVRREGAGLALPSGAFQLPSDSPRPNILILVVDSWRKDMLNPEVTPRLWAFAQGARRFEDHLSGGNATRFGLFSLLYGLHGSYWWPVLEEQRSPLLVDVLMQAGYGARVFSSASMEFPEFRSTAWVSIQASVEDQFPSERRAVRDELLGRRFAEWIAEPKTTSAPFFAFALLDSAHQTYDFPADQTPFRPFAEELDYLEMARTHDELLRERVRNRYQNALYYADSIAGAMLDALECSGQLENTIVLITGDHGEEFAENGHWGHTSNFTPEQVSVPMILRGPGIEPGIERRPTSHVDVAATLLEACGLPESLRGSWTVGGNLLSPSLKRERVVAGWDELGLWTADAIFRVPLDIERPLELAAYDSHWNLLADQDRVIAEQAQALQELSRACTMFLAPSGARVARGSR